MSVFVILSLALAVMAGAVLILAGVQLWRAVRRLADAARAVRTRLAPLTEELQTEIAVAGTEADALRQTLDGWQRARHERRADKQGLREGVRRAARGR